MSRDETFEVYITLDPPLVVKGLGAAIKSAKRWVLDSAISCASNYMSSTAVEEKFREELRIKNTPKPRHLAENMEFG